jgi:hypothetical protein
MGQVELKLPRHWSFKGRYSELILLSNKISNLYELHELHSKLLPTINNTINSSYFSWIKDLIDANTHSKHFSIDRCDIKPGWSRDL